MVICSHCGSKDCRIEDYEMDNGYKTWIEPLYICENCPHESNEAVQYEEGGAYFF